MDIKRYKWHFQRFLIEYKVYKTFIDNVESKNNQFKEEFGILSLKYLLAELRPKEWIVHAFNWGKTKQGSKFWDDVNEEWLATVNDLDKL